MITCYKCGSRKVTHYKQIRSDGEIVITARCENGHSPVKGKPFFPKWQFDLSKLSLLPSQAQMELPIANPRPRVVIQPVELPYYPKPKAPQKDTGKNIPERIEE